MKSFFEIHNELNAIERDDIQEIGTYWAHQGFCMVKRSDIIYGKNRQARQKGAVVTNRRTNASHLQPRKNVN